MSVSPSFYERLTGDTRTEPDMVRAALSDATRALEDMLGRGVDSAEHTETLPVYDGVAFPSTTPVTAFDGAHTTEAIIDVAGPTVTVTYTGGWVDEGDIPWSIRKDIVWNAWRLLHPSQVPSGASTIKVGDVSVTYNSEAQAAELPWSEATMRWRRRSV